MINLNFPHILNCFLLIYFYSFIIIYSCNKYIDIQSLYAMLKTRNKRSLLLKKILLISSERYCRLVYR